MFIALLALSRAVCAASGDLDTSFQSGLGYAIKAFDLGGNDGDSVTSVLVQSSGGIVLVGYAQTGASSTQIAMTRLLPDGTVDSSFGSGGSVAVSPGVALTNALVTGAALDPGDGIYVAGYSTSTGGNGFVGHFTASGQLDNGFASAGFAISGPYSFFAVAVDNSGKPVAVGMSGTFGASQLVVERLTSSGNLDPGFNNGNPFVATIGTATISSDQAGALTFDGAGRIYVGAAAGVNNANSVSSPAILRLTPLGQLDATCGTAGVISTTFSGSKTQAASIIFRDAHHGIWTGADVGGDLVAFDFDADDCSGGTSPGLISTGVTRSGYSVAASDGAVYISYTTIAVPDESQIVTLHNGLPFNSQPFTIYPATTSNGEHITLSGGRPLQAIRQTGPGANVDFAVARFQNDRVFFANFDRDAPY